MRQSNSGMRLYSTQAQRLYLNQTERIAIEKYALNEEANVRYLLFVLLRTGCRLSEALNITHNDLQVHDGLIAIRSLKKREKKHVRELPVPYELVSQLAKLTQHSQGTHPFPQSRTTAWRQIKKAMDETGIVGTHATPKGLRHSFGVHCALNNIPMTLIQKWMGHADIQTTAIYAQIVGQEERKMAERLW